MTSTLDPGATAIVGAAGNPVAGVLAVELVVGVLLGSGLEKCEIFDKVAGPSRSIAPRLGRELTGVIVLGMLLSGVSEGIAVGIGPVTTTGRAESWGEGASPWAIEGVIGVPAFPTA